jgi:mycothiol synthase
MIDWESFTTLIDHRAFSDAEAIALNTFQNRIRAEAWPDDLPRPVDDTRDRLRSMPGFVTFRLWAVWNADNTAIIATASVEMLEEVEHNQHLAFCDISVLPEMRRQGIGKFLLGKIRDAVREQGRWLLVFDIDSMVPAGEAFICRLGAGVGLAEEINELELDNANWDLVKGWISRAEERARGFELGLWDGPFPEEDIDAAVGLLKVMNTAPKDDLDLGDFEWSADQVRAMDASWQTRKLERWVMYARHAETGDLAGYTMVFWNPRDPEILGQADTGVFPQYRRRGLGRWLKAAMVEKVRRDRPEVKRIRTDNAKSNAPMLKINRELGFKVTKTITAWQVEVDKVEAYLRTP